MTQRTAQRRSVLYIVAIYLNAFLLGGIIMGYEMLGSRFMSPIFGGDIFTWGALISTVLLSLMTGAYLGGHLADRKPSALVLGGCLVVAALYLVTLPLYAEEAMLLIADGIDDGPIGRILAALVLNLVPVSLFGIYTPFAVRLLIRSTGASGRLVGYVSATSSLGSIVGTLYTTFILIPAMGSQPLTYVFAAATIVCAVSLMALKWLMPESDAHEVPRPAAADAPRTQQGPKRRLPPLYIAATYGNAFLLGGIIMGYEMLGSRFIAPIFGSDIYTWGALISTVMLSMMVGAFLGGHLADRKPSIMVLGLCIVVGALYLLVLPLFLEDGFLFIADEIDGGPFGRLLAALLLNLVPVSLVGIYTPFAVRLLIRSAGASGRLVGAVSATSSFGSIAGTLFTTFFLIPTIGSQSMTYLFAGAALLCALSLIGLKWLMTETPDAESLGSGPSPSAAGEPERASGHA